MFYEGRIKIIHAASLNKLCANMASLKLALKLLAPRSSSAVLIISFRNSTVNQN